MKSLFLTTSHGGEKATAANIKNMTDDKIEIEQLIKDVFSDNWELVKSSANRLEQIGGDEVVDFLISLIALDNSGIRNRAALALEIIKDNQESNPLIYLQSDSRELNFVICPL